MRPLFTLQEFYANFFDGKHSKQYAVLPKTGHFNVFERGQFCKKLTHIHRSDFYKISLVVGTGTLHLEDRSIDVSGHTLIFFNPSLPHLFEPISAKQEGYFCLFNAEFIKGTLHDTYVRSSPLFNPRLNPVYTLSERQSEDLAFIYKKMMGEMDSDYIHKYELIHHYLHLIIHESNKTQPVYLTSEKYPSASSRIASLFIEMLERQFPVDSTEHSLKLKSPHDFAEKLSVHVNHLNRSVKEFSGNSTSEIIAARICAEAQTLLQHTDNTIAEIAYSLGFEHPSNFNIFFKKQTKLTPKAVRERLQRKQSIAA